MGSPWVDVPVLVIVLLQRGKKEEGKGKQVRFDVRSRVPWRLVRYLGCPSL